MALAHSTAAKNAILDAIDALINTGAGTAQIKIRAGSVGAPGTVLATVNLGNPAFGAASSGAMTMSGLPVSDTSADATGTAGMFEITDRDGVVVVSGSVTATGGGGDMTMPSVSITATEPVNVNTFTYNAPA